MEDKIQNVQISNRVREYLNASGYNSNEIQIFSMRTAMKSFGEIEKELGVKEKEATETLRQMEQTMRRYAKCVEYLFERAIENDDERNIANLEGLNMRAINRLRGLGIYTIEDLKKAPEDFIRKAKIRGLGPRTKEMIIDLKNNI